jgi:hypothetical protein
MKNREVYQELKQMRITKQEIARNTTRLQTLTQRIHLQSRDQ